MTGPRAIQRRMTGTGGTTSLPAWREPAASRTVRQQGFAPFLFIGAPIKSMEHRHDKPARALATVYQALFLEKGAGTAVAKIDTTIQVCNRMVLLVLAAGKRES